MIVRKKSFIFILTGILFLSPSFIKAQDVIISGRIYDKNDLLPIQGAAVYVKDKGVLSKDDGTYKLSLGKGNYELIISFIGYRKKTLRISAYTDQTINIPMEDDNLLNEVVISSREKNANVSGMNMGLNQLSAKEIKRMPALLGETDVLKSLQLLPGVQASSEGSSGFSVRGGSPDQNLILLDNTTVYNASHLMGFFSVFNNDALSGVDLYKGDIPARYNGRLSSLLDVRTKDDIPRKIEGKGGIGLISSRLTIDGPIGDKTSWLIAGRRSYADLFLKLSSNKNQRNVSLYFYDLNAKISHKFNSRDNLDLNFYNGKDNFGAQAGVFDYENALGSITWNHKFSDKFLSKTSFHYSGYTSGMESKLEGSKAKERSGIKDYTARLDFYDFINNSFNLNFGISSTFHDFRPQILNMEGYPSTTVKGSQSLENVLYFSNEQKISNNFSIKYGIRFSDFANFGGNTYGHF